MAGSKNAALDPTKKVALIPVETIENTTII
jgi:hypothetical protein